MTGLLNLHGKKGLVVGIANEHSIAYGCAQVFRRAGAELALTYLNDRAKPHVAPLAETLGAGIFLPCDVQNAAQIHGLMGPVKAALESATRYMAAELGVNNIRVNALSSGTVSTRAASGITGFDELMKQSHKKAPLHRDIDLDDIGNMAAFFVSDLAKNITGGVHVIDAGYRMMD